MSYGGDYNNYNRGGGGGGFDDDDADDLYEGFNYSIDVNPVPQTGFQSTGYQPQPGTIATGSRSSSKAKARSRDIEEQVPPGILFHSQELF